MMMTYGTQVGINVLGVVENMSGLRQPAAKFRFLAPQTSGGEQDVTEKVLAAIRQHVPEAQVQPVMITIILLPQTLVKLPSVALRGHAGGFAAMLEGWLSSKDAETRR